MNEWDELGFKGPQGAPPPNNGAGQYAPPNVGTGQYAHPGGTGYGAPPPQYVPRVRGGQGGGWISFLRVFLWIWFAIICLAGIICAVIVVRGEPLLMLLILLATALVAFASVAGGMVILDAAANIQTCATNSAHILTELQKRNSQR